jgi:hypothetical protein
MNWLNPINVKNAPKMTAALAAFFIFMGPISAKAARAEVAADPYLIMEDEPLVEVVEEGQVPLELIEAVTPGGVDGFDFKRNVNPNPNPSPTSTTSGPTGTSVDKAELVLDKVINMGRKVWAIVEANKPVVSFEGNTANALPQGVTSWDALQGWAAPSSRLYTYTYKNGFRMNVVKFSFRVLYTHGGSVNGKGRYLANVNVVPASLDVLWGYKFNASAAVPSVLNASRVAGEPIAAAEILVSWKVETVLKHSRRSVSLYARGDGVFKDLTNGN